jgi:hypothetical protein
MNKTSKKKEIRKKTENNLAVPKSPAKPAPKQMPKKKKK